MLDRHADSTIRELNMISSKTKLNIACAVLPSPTSYFNLRILDRVFCRPLPSQLAAARPLSQQSPGPVWTFGCHGVIQSQPQPNHVNSGRRILRAASRRSQSKYYGHDPKP